MSDRVKTDDKYFIEKFKLELKRLNKAMSGLFKLSVDRGAKKTDDKMHFLFHQAGSVTQKYTGHHYHHFDQISKAASLLEKNLPKSMLEKKAEEARNSFCHEFRHRITSDYRPKVDVKMSNDGCGHFTDPDRFVIPIMYSKIIKEIGDLSANKMIVYAKPHKHDTFKCWKAQYYTFNRLNGRRHYKSVDCFIMKDNHSGVTYYHTDYRLCADGMRRAIGRKVARRMGL